MSAARKISDGQRRMLFGQARKHGYDHDALRDLVESVTGVRSIAQLSARQASAVIERFAPGSARRNERGRGMATKKQLGLIRYLWDCLGELGYYGPEARDKALRRFVEARFKVSDLRFLTVYKARQAIEGLKAIEERLAGQGGKAA